MASYDIGERLRYLRKRSGNTQRGLSNDSGVSRITISMIETGRQRPSRRVLERLAAALRVSPEELSDPHLPPHRIPPKGELQTAPRTASSKTRLSIEMSTDLAKALDALSDEQSATKTEILRSALQSHLENIGYESSYLHEDISGQKITRRIRVRSVKQVIFHSTLLINAFEEALDYDTKRHHNQPPPALRLENDEYLEEIRNLVSELKKMNSFLESLSNKKRTKSAPPIHLQKHLDIFLKKYSSTLGYGAGIMTLGVIATLLYQLGVGEAVFDHVLRKTPLR